MPRVLVVASAWPTYRQPTALIHGLRAAGARVAVAHATRRWWRLARWDGLYVPALPEGARCAAGSTCSVVAVVDAPAPTEDEDVRRLLLGATLVLAAAPALGEQAVAAGADPKRLRVVSPAVRVPPPSPFPATCSPVRIRCRAPLHWTAGHAYGLMAIRLLCDRGVDVRLELVGSGPDDEAVRFALADLDLQAIASLSPEVGRTGAHVFMLPAVEDRPWLELIEAMAAGLPVVASDLPSIRQVVRTGVDGLLVPARDPAALADALVQAIARPALGRAARQRAESLAQPSRFPALLPDAWPS